MEFNLNKKCCSEKCSEIYRKEYDILNKFHYKKVKNWRKRRKVQSILYKGGKCEKCGYDKCLSALEFHHIDPSKKDFTISTVINRKFEKIKNELDKCVLVCANCHREIHEKIKLSDGLTG